MNLSQHECFRVVSSGEVLVLLVPATALFNSLASCLVLISLVASNIVVLIGRFIPQPSFGPPLFVVFHKCVAWWVVGLLLVPNSVGVGASMHLTIPP